MNQTVRNLAIAIALALVGVVLTTSYIKSAKQNLERGKEQVTVLVAKKAIPAGTPAKSLIDGGYVEEAEILREDQPIGALGDLKGMSRVNTNQIIGKGDFLTSGKFGTKQSLNPADAIKGTERYASFAIHPMGRVLDFIQVGDHVDAVACSKEVGLQKTQAAAIKKLVNEGAIPGQVCWVAARDLVVEATPASVMPKSEGADEETPAEPLQAKDDPALYGFTASDETLMEVYYSYAVADDVKLFLMLRPSDGDQESKIEPTVTIPDNT
jgi:hypothetical protein